MIIELIIVIIGMLVAQWGGFYLGYLKREDKPPEMPTIPVKRFTMKKEKEAEPKGFYD
jgi:hypothetical protein